MKIETHCVKCCFAITDGCKLNLHEIFNQRGQLQKVDGNTVITGTICPRFRTKQWWDTYKDTYVEQLAFESRIEYVGLVVATESSTIEDVEKTLSSLVVQEPAPVGIFIINMFSKIGDKTLLEAVKKCTDNYMVNTITDPDYRIGDGIDFALNYTKQNYILVSKAGKEIDNGFVKFAQQSVYRNFKIIGLLLIDEGNYLIDRRLYKIEKYNFMEDIVKKYPEFCEKWQNVSA